jgi:hypothetical protein
VRHARSIAATVTVIALVVGGLAAAPEPPAPAVAAAPEPAAPAVAAAPGPPARSARASIVVVATGLEQPKKVTIAPDGALLVAASGDGVAPASCTNGSQRSCLDRSGAIDRVTTSGSVSALLGGLASVSSGSTAGVAAGPAEARSVGGHTVALFQDQDIDRHSGRQPFGRSGAALGDLVRYGAGRVAHVIGAFGPYEARHNPDHGRGTDVALGTEPGIDSDPYAFVPYRGGYAVADAGGNDLLFVSRTGAIRVLAVFGTIRESAAPGSFGAFQKHRIRAKAQAVPDALAVGPDGALYVGELSGTPYDVGASSVYRVVPGHAATVVARGLTSIADLAFDSRGRLLVLEIDRRGLQDPALLAGRTPASGAIIRIGPGGRRTTVVSAGLEFPTGMAVAADGSVYVTARGIDSPVAGTPGSGGELLRVTAPGL